ncbi:MAG: DUF2490 domain-containing protein [bacterium]
MKYLYVGLLFVLMVSGIVSADDEFWFINGYKFPTIGGVKGNAILELRYKGTINDIYYEQLYLGPTFDINSNYLINLFYAAKNSRSNGTWQSSSLGYFDLNYKYPVNSLTLGGRSRMEYDMNSTVLKYRQLLKVQSGGLSLGTELFYAPVKNIWDEGRYTLAYSIKYMNMDFNAGYMLRLQKANAASAWVQQNAVTTGVNIDFK